MLKHIDPILIPDLLYGLAKMGHGDTVVVADRNFPAFAAGAPVVALAGVDAVEAVAAICSVMPLDRFVDQPLAAMAPTGGGALSPATGAVEAVAERAEGRSVKARPVERFDFYRESRSAALVVATGESRPYGCYILQKGVWPPLSPEPS
ncbi:MAG: fucose isomerase [Bifidobacteriaceae bacterium]|jgi:L-fucose mutarotase|nr:fucose isomerase [Bifidobacteriaceae bacterium]